jgi:lipoprotein-anchoring transpeptidase ErfK/SrfK
MRHFILFFVSALCLSAQQATDEAPILRALPIDAGEVIIPPTDPTPPKAVLITPAPPVVPATSIETTPAIASPPGEKPTGDDATRLQIFLDQSNFGPGVIDGKIGLFSQLAVKSWNEVNGHPLDDWSAVNAAARREIPNPYAVALVPEIATEWVNPKLSQNRTEQAKAKRMSYRSFVEFMSERYHTDIPTLTRLNPGKNIYGLQPKASIIVPNVQPFLIENLSDRAYHALEDLSDRYVVVDTKINQVRIFAGAPKPNIITDPNAPIAPRPNTALLASFPITPGKPEFVKFGSWKLQNMVELPWWRYDQQHLDTGKRSANALMIPPGPNLPVGIIWCGTTRSGIGLHGTAEPETIGRSRSAGCIRLCNWDAIRLPTLVRPGATVEIR